MSFEVPCARLASRFDAALIEFAAAPMLVVPVYEGGMAPLAKVAARDVERVRAALAAAEARSRTVLPFQDAEQAEWRSSEEKPVGALVRG